MSVTPSGPEKVSVYEWLKMQCLYVGPAGGYLVTIPGTGLQDVSTVLSKESVRLLLCCFLVTFGKANISRRVSVSLEQHGRSWVRCGCVYQYTKTVISPAL